jgi:type I restriction enzyme S subunit
MDSKNCCLGKGGDTLMNVPEIRFKGFSGEWEERKLGEVVEKQRSYSLSRDAETKEASGYRYIHYGDIHKQVADLIISDEQLPKIKEGDYLSLNKGDLVLADASEDYTGIAEPSVILHKPSDNIIAGLHTIALRPIETDSLYLYYLFHTSHFKKFGGETGTGLKVFGITFNNLSKYETSYPTFSEQRVIGDFFHTLDDIIVLHKRKLGELRKLKAGYLQQMFPQADESVPRVRFAGFSGKWEERRLGEVAEHFEYGLNASAKYFDGVNKYIRITDIDEDLRCFKQDNLTSPDIDFTVAQNYLLKRGDILFARTGASVGKTYIHKNDDADIYFAGFLIRARFFNEYDSEFIYQNTLTENYNTFVRIMSQRSGQPGVNAQEYANFSLSIPSIEEQQKIGVFFRNIDEQIINQKTKLDKLKQLKTAYLQKMFV